MYHLVFILMPLKYIFEEEYVIKYENITMYKNLIYDKMKF